MSMNMWCTGLLCFLINPFTDWVINKSENIVEIIPSTQAKHTNGRPIVSSESSGSLNNKQIVYEPVALRAMWECLQHDQGLRQLPFGTLDRIRKLDLNNKPTKNKLHLHQQLHQYRINLHNLIRIKKSGYKLDTKIAFATCNIQYHDHWKDTTILNHDNLRLCTADWKTGKGGGLALIHKVQYPVEYIRSGYKASFEFATWELRIKNNTITIHGIYHPPYSTTNKITNAKFIEEFTDHVSSCLPTHQNNIFIGDFNLHISNQLDTDATIFGDSIDALGLYQHVGFGMHRLGNVLDLVLSDFTNEAKVLTAAPGPFLTDHRAIISTLNLKKLKPVTKKILVRQVSKIKLNQWMEEFKLENTKF